MTSSGQARGSTSKQLSVKLDGFFPRVEAVTVAGRHFDLTSLEGLRGWILATAAVAGWHPSETFHLNKEDAEKCR